MGSGTAESWHGTGLLGQDGVGLRGDCSFSQCPEPAVARGRPSPQSDPQSVMKDLAVRGRCNAVSMSPVENPDALSAAVVHRINAGDLDGLLDLYERDAVLELPDGQLATGHDQIRSFYAELLEGRPHFAPGRVLPALVADGLALTTTQIGSSASVEVARRQADGGWRWLIDRPDVLRPTDSR